MSAGYTYYIHEVAVHSDIALGPHLREHGRARHTLQLSAPGSDGSRQGVDVLVASMVAHNKLLKAYSDRDTERVDPGQPWRVVIDDVVQFSWTSGRHSITYQLQGKASVEAMSFWFTHIVLPVFLASENLFDFIHAAALKAGPGALVLVAPTMGGKSTLAHHFIRQGHALITDDKLATYVEGKQIMATASHRYHRPYRAYGELGVEAALSTDETLPITAIFCLDRPAGGTELGISTLTGADKMAALLDNSMFAFKHRARAHFANLAQLVKRVPVYAVQLPDDMNRLGDVYALIMAQYEARSTQ